MLAKKVFLLCMCFMGLFVLQTHAQKMTIKLASIVPSRSNWDVEQHAIAQKWYQVSGGQITLQYMNATAMGGEAGVIQKLNSIRPGQKAPINGAIFTSLGMYMLAPESNILTTCVPFLFRNQEEVHVMLDAYAKDMQRAINEKGYVVLGWFSVGWAYFFTKSPAHSLGELKKMRLCVGNMTAPELTNAFKAAGFQTLDVPYDKISQSIRTPGGIEGLYTLPMYAYAAQYTKSLPYILNVPLCPVMAAFMVSKETWEKIPDAWKPDLIQAVLDAGNKFDNNAAVDDAEYIKRCQEAGCTVVSLSADELKRYEMEFREDVKKMYSGNNPVINKQLYDGIVALLKKHRGE